VLCNFCQLTPRFEDFQQEFLSLSQAQQDIMWNMWELGANRLDLAKRCKQ
jgi:hypothetical protein